MKSLFLINARSGKKRGYDIAELIRASCAEWSHPHELVPCRSKEELDDVIGGAADGGFDVVYAVGGDGTVHEIAKRLVDTTLALGILPTGSGNGFARHVGLPTEPRASLLACRGRRIVTIDTAQVNGTTFLGVMGIGFDALIADRFASSSVRGMWTYVQLGMREFGGYTCEEYELEIDGERSTRRAFVIAIANSSQYGNDARIAPRASVTDGLLDVVIIEKKPIFRAPLLLARLFGGTLHRVSGVRTLRAANVTIRRKRSGAAHLDGEPVTLPEFLEVRVRPRSLRLLVPDRERSI